jgi:hypothetical protein
MSWLTYDLSSIVFVSSSLIANLIHFPTQTLFLADPGPGEEPAFHCHMDSTHCVGDEKWMTPQEVTDAGYGPCGCSEEYEENVFIHTCYDTGGSRQVVCAYDENQVRARMPRP